MKKYFFNIGAQKILTLVYLEECKFKIFKNYGRSVHLNSQQKIFNTNASPHLTPRKCWILCHKFHSQTTVIIVPAFSFTSKTKRGWNEIKSSPLSIFHSAGRFSQSILTFYNSFCRIALCCVSAVLCVYLLTYEWYPGWMIDSHCLAFMRC
jgi:hypothetical protein